MKRMLAIVLVTVFVAGSLLLPILHRAHCHDHDGCDGQAGHDESHCPICQLVNAPMQDSAPLIEPVAVQVDYVVHAVQPRLIISAVPGDSSQARAPPVA